VFSQQHFTEVLSILEQKY